MKNFSLSFVTLASVASMATVWAACTVTTNPAATTDGGTTGSDATTGTDAKQTKKDSGVVDTDAAVATCDRVPTAAEFTAIPYKPAKPKQAGACTAAEITALGTANTAAEIKAAASAACIACAISAETDATWAVTLVDAAGDFSNVNFGACYEAATNAECGKTQQKFQTCGDLVCSNCATDPDAQACIDDAYLDTGICQTTNFGTCSDADVTKAGAACGTSYASALKYMCGN
jgi:hypothetical protein